MQIITHTELLQISYCISGISLWSFQTPQIVFKSNFKKLMALIKWNTVKKARGSHTLHSELLLQSETLPISLDLLLQDHAIFMQLFSPLHVCQSGNSLAGLVA